MKYSVWQMKGMGEIGVKHFECDNLRNLFVAIVKTMTKAEKHSEIETMNNSTLLDVVLTFNKHFANKAVRYIKWTENSRKMCIDLTKKTIAKILSRDFQFK